jgi:cytochrome oxidase assembly protein ShyY1
MSSPLVKPRWLLGHVLIITATVGFTLLGFWQLDRHFQQREDNALTEARLAAPPIDLTTAPAPWTDLALRRVTVVGRYDYTAQLELRPRARNGRVGYDQVIPLLTGGGVVLVNRGFIADADGSARLTPQRPEAITVEGTVRPSQGTSSLGPQNPATGALETIVRIDLDRLNPQFQNALAPVYLDLISEVPDPGGLPTVVPALPEPTSRPNLLYAIQWWAFAGVASIGWAAYLRKQFFAT